MYYSERRVPTFVEAIHKAQRERKREDSGEDSEICESVTVKSAVVFMFREKGGTFSVKVCLAAGETVLLRFYFLIWFGTWECPKISQFLEIKLIILHFKMLEE